MNMVRLDPWGNLDNMRRDFDRLFGAATGGGRLAEVFHPEVDVEESEDAVRLYVDLPGVDRESIDVQLTGDTLTLSAERKYSKPENATVIHRERHFGNFQRSFTLSVPVQIEKVDAQYRDGVLTVTLPKTEAVRPRKIEVKAAGDD